MSKKLKRPKFGQFWHLAVSKKTNPQNEKVQKRAIFLKNFFT